MRSVYENYFVLDVLVEAVYFSVDPYMRCVFFLIINHFAKYSVYFRFFGLISVLIFTAKLLLNNANLKKGYKNNLKLN